MIHPRNSICAATLWGGLSFLLVGSPALAAFHLVRSGTGLASATPAGTIALDSPSLAERHDADTCPLCRLLGQGRLIEPPRPRPLPAAELWGCIERTLEQLCTEHRDVLRLRDADGLEYQEISLRRELPLGTVRSRLLRARARLRAAIAERFSQGPQPRNAA